MAQRRISTLCMIVCCQYFLGTVFFVGTPIILVIWLLLSFVVALFVKPTAIFVIFSIYAVFGIFYSTGFVSESWGVATPFYYRSILAWSIFSTLVYGFASGNVKGIKNGLSIGIKIERVQFLAILLFAGWSFVGLRDLNSGILVDYRDITGNGYLTLSDAFALFSIAYMCRERIPSWELSIVFGLSLVVIFLLGSRTTLVFYPFAVAFLIGRNVSAKGALLWAVALGGSLYYAFRDFVDLNSGAFFRFNSLFVMGQDRSGAVRDTIRQDMLDRIEENPECLIIACHPEAGLYDHSVLSVIQHFGIFGIAFLIFFFVIGFLRFRFIIAQWYFPILVYCTVSLVLSRAWLSVIFPVFIGLMLAALFARSKMSATPEADQDLQPSLGAGVHLKRIEV